MATPVSLGSFLLRYTRPQQPHLGRQFGLHVEHRFARRCQLLRRRPASPGRPSRGEVLGVAAPARKVADAVGAEAGQDVLVDGAAVRLLGQRRQSTGHGEELLGPDRQGHVGAPGVEPVTPVHLDLDLPEVALGVRLADERLAALVAERVAVAGPVLAVSLLDASDLEPPVDSQGACREHAGSEPGVFRGLQRSLPVNTGHRENHPCRGCRMDRGPSPWREPPIGRIWSWGSTFGRLSGTSCG